VEGKTTGKMKDLYKILVGKHRGDQHLGEDRRIILKRIVQEMDGCGLDSSGSG
jgi:hypothetical protein